MPTPRKVDPKYLAWIRSKECLALTESGPCNGIMTTHHIYRVGGHRTRDDRFTVPLCVQHHTDGDGVILKPLDAKETKAYFIEQSHKLLVEYLDE
jgi:hypothetical protein